MMMGPFFVRGRFCRTAHKIEILQVSAKLSETESLDIVLNAVMHMAREIPADGNIWEVTRELVK